MNNYELEEPSRVWDTVNVLQVVDAVSNDDDKLMAELAPGTTQFCSPDLVVPISISNWCIWRSAAEFNLQAFLQSLTRQNSPGTASVNIDQ